MTNSTTNNRKPTHEVLHVRGEGDKAHWTRIGAAWMHDDQKGLNLSLDFLPVKADGRLVIRVRQEKEGK
jgi:hypothetical protein